MKKIKKTMLVLVLTLILGITTNVYAIEPNSESLNELPEMVNIDAKEIDYVNDWERVDNQIKENISNLLEEKGIEIDGNNYTISAGVNINTDGKDYHNLHVTLNQKVAENGYMNIASKTIKLKFTDTASYATLRGDINSKLATISGNTFYYLDRAENEIVIKLENGIYTNKVDDFFTNKLRKQFNNNSIEVSLDSGYGSTGGPEDFTTTLKEYKEMTESHQGRMFLSVYKDNVSLGETVITLKLGVGYSNGTNSVLMNNIDSNNDTYTGMQNELNKKGYSNIITAYELTLVEGTINGKLSVSIPVDTKYNGKEVVILHKKADGSYEEFTTTVSDGKANIEVTELSPFMVALKDGGSTATEVSNNAQTGSINIILLSILSVLSLSGIIYLVVRKKKVA